MHIQKRWAARLGAVAVAGGLLATVGLGSATSVASSPFGKPHKATGKPYVFVMVNLEGGPVQFNEAQQGAQAAIDYVNAYKDGINNHPIVLKECSDTTLTPATSATCANQLVADNPVLVLGGADIGSAGLVPGLAVAQPRLCRRFVLHAG